MRRSTNLQFYVLIFSLTLFSFKNTFAQEVDMADYQEERDYKVRPLRLGLKIGFPNLVGGNLEYVTPLLNDKLALNVDYSNIRSDWLISEDEEPEMTENTELNFTYFEGGLNYYFFKAGKGLYGGMSYGNFKIEGTATASKDGVDGTGNVELNHSSFNVKLGAKLGELFYFRPEIGYSFSSLPKSVDYTVRYEDGTVEQDTYDFKEEVAPADILFKGLMANIGFGFAF